MWRRKLRERDLERELCAHLELEAAEQRENGLASEEARYAARRALGNTTLLKEAVRGMWGLMPLERFYQDLRYGLRTLRKNPSFTATAVLSLALGIGGNTAIFTAVNAVLLKMLPVRDPRQLMLLRPVPYPAYEVLRDQNGVFSSMLACASVGLAGTAGPIEGQLVSGSYFETLGVDAALGRRLTIADDLQSATPAAVISYSYWRGHFAADPAALGRSISLNGIPVTIVGVAPPDFFGLDLGNRPDVYVPLSLEARLRPASDALRARLRWWVTTMGRLRPGVSERQAQADLDRIFPEFLRATVASVPLGGSENRKAAFLRERVILEPGSKGLSKLRKQFARPLLVLMGVVALVLLITCANLANLLLSRSVAREREIALRVAVGAGRGRVIRQLLTESIVLAALGGGAGLALAQWGIRLLPGLLGAPSVDLRLDLRVVLFTASLSLLTGLVFSVLPALRASQIDIVPALKQVGRAPRLAAGRYLSVFQVALSIVLLVGAGLFVRTFQNLASVDLGFVRGRMVLFSVNPGGSAFTGPRLQNLYGELAARLSTLPGVSSVSFSQASLFGGNDSTTTISEFGSMPAVHENSHAHRNIVSPGFFRTLGIHLLAGRDFTERDREGAPKAAIVNETFARQFFGSRTALGKTLGYAAGQSSGPVAIVGIAADSKYNDPREQRIPMVFLPYRQFPSIAGMTFELRTTSEPSALEQAIRGQVGTHLTIANITTIDRQIDDSLRPERTIATLVSLFGLVALLLAAVGLFGVVNYSVTRRTNEIGIRMAIGAKPREMLRMVLREAVWLVGCGLAVGIPAAWAAGRLAGSLLFGVTATDPYALAAAITVLLIAALTAAFLPAHRASRIDPL
ncbi:MAG TPA: ABC transporter permease, partial [Bryobacteraceae bacterium]|nr:ABC transporter permease [Bryobacteraceae bacterium]